MIERRREFSRFYSLQAENIGNPDSKLHIKNDSHLHIIRVLESVFQTLQAKAKLSLKYDGDLCSKLPMNQEIAAVNLYENLELQQPSVDDCIDFEDGMENLIMNSARGKPRKEVKKSSKLDTTSSPATLSTDDIEYEPVPDDDADFVIHCFLQDFNKIRTYLDERWCDYNEGLVSLTSISITTNTAFDFFRRAV